MADELFQDIAATISDLKVKSINDLLGAAEEAREQLDAPGMPKSAVWFRGQSGGKV